MDLPEGFLEQFAPYGVPALDSLASALAGEPSVSVRYNRSKCITPHSAGTSDVVPWCPEGRYLPERPQFTLDPAVHQGLYYVQDASSMFISHVVSHLTASGNPVTYLDACAAPGGKTTAAIDAFPARSVVVANEYVAQRAAVLRENLAKWGVPCAVCQGDTSRFAAAGAMFDIIAADVPCSGEGMMRKDPKAVEQWSPQLVAECAARQRQIVDALWPALAPGGYIIYSTCTFNTAENEDMVRYLIDRYGAEPVAVPVNDTWGILPAIGADFPAYRFIPGAVRGEGLFMAVLRKPADADDSGASSRSSSRKNRRQAPSPKPSPSIREAEKWLVPGTGATFAESPDGTVTATFPALQPGFPFHPALTVASVRGRDLVPSQELAMSCLLAPDAFPRCEVGLPVALEYLRAQAVTLPPDTPRGIVLLTYGGRPLGFVKNIGSRANNLYPRQWRILK